MPDLSTLTPDEILSTLAAETARHRRDKQTLQRFFLGVFVVVLGFYLFLAFVKKSAVDFSSFASLTALIGCGAAFSSTHRAALKEAGKLGSKEAAGPLLEAYVETDERSIIDICREALPKALSQVHSADDFDAYQRGLLNKVLVTRYPIAVVSAAVECMGRVSGVEAIPSLEKFQSEAANDKRPEWQRLGQRTLQILPDVRMRVAREIIDRKLTEAERLRAERMARIEPDGHVQA